jgi:hypothetical protein
MRKPSTKQSRTHYLFLLIVAAVARAPRRITVRDIGRELGYEPDVIAHCIALHLFLERRNDAMPIPPPIEYVVPGPDDIITRGMLAPAEGQR